MSEARRVGAVLGLLFLLGLGLRLPALSRPHQEGDEQIYGALVEQLRAGRGYTLRGHPLLASPGFPAEIYDEPLFPQHPPGGVLLFLLLDVVVPGRGPAAAQLLGYALFFAGTCLLWAAVAPERRAPGLVLVGLTAAFTPLAAHVFTRHWLDGPLLGFVSLGAGLFLLGVREGRPLPVLGGAALVGASAWIKLTALGVLPWVLGVAWTLRGPGGRSFVVRSSGVLACFALFLILPWFAYQEAVLGRLSVAARPPSAELLAANPYIRLITRERSPFIYLTLAPRVLWTLVPAVGAAWLCRRDGPLGPRSAALGLWILGTLGSYVFLGSLGYSRLLRYAVLVSPALCVLVATAAEGLAARVKHGGAGGSRVARAGLAALGLGLCLEVLQGLLQSLVSRRDLVVPLTHYLLR